MFCGSAFTLMVCNEILLFGGSLSESCVGYTSKVRQRVGKANAQPAPPFETHAQFIRIFRAGRQPAVVVLPSPPSLRAFTLLGHGLFTIMCSNCSECCQSPRSSERSAHNSESLSVLTDTPDELTSCSGMCVRDLWTELGTKWQVLMNSWSWGCKLTSTLSTLSLALSFPNPADSFLPCFATAQFVCPIRLECVGGKERGTGKC